MSDIIRFEIDGTIFNVECDDLGSPLSSPNDDSVPTGVGSSARKVLKDKVVSISEDQFRNLIRSMRTFSKVVYEDFVVDEPDEVCGQKKVRLEMGFSIGADLSIKILKSSNSSSMKLSIEWL